MAAATWTSRPSALAEIERAAAEIPVEGERYPAHLLAATGR